MRIRKKFTISMLFTAMLPLVIFMGLSLWNSTLQTTKLTLDVAQGRLDTAAQKLSTFFSERIAEVSAYSQTSLMKTMQFASIRPFLMSELERHKGVYEKFILGTPKGHFYNTSGGNPHLGGLRTFNDREPNAKPKHIRKRDYWQVTVGKNNEARQHTYVSDPMISYTTGAKQVVVASTIISANGQVVGMIGGALPWTDIQKRIKQVNDEVIVQLGWEAKFFLISHTGTYWYHWDPENVVHLVLDEQGAPRLNEIGEKTVVKNNIQKETIPEMVVAGERMLRGESGYTSFVAPESGKRNYLVFSPIPSANYSVGLLVPHKQMMAEVENLQSIFIYSFILVAAGVMLVALFVSRRVSSPIMSLNTMIKEISQGNWSMKLKPEGHDEIRELTESFNSMANTLERREHMLKQSEENLEKMNAELEHRITERTHELELTNANLNQQIEERKTIEHALRQSEDLLKNTGHLAHVGGWKLEVAKEELSWTEETFKIHGLAPETNIDLNTAINYFAVDSQPVFEAAVQKAIRYGTAFDLELLLYTSMGLEVWVRVICHVNKEADCIVELVGAYQDITELKKVEKLKSEFVSMVSHELRTPLTSIRGALSLLNSGQIMVIENEVAKQMLDVAERNSDRLLLLINDLLDLDKIESGKMDFKFSLFQLNPLLKQSLLENESYGKKFSVCYKLGENIPNVQVKVDKERFLQVMSNLLSNAAKFTAKDTPVNVDASLVNNSAVRILVKDHGAGIPEDFQEKIFTKFSQADSSDTRKQGGTGLGLVICKSIIENMGGDIGYNTVIGEGSTFYFTLPLSGVRLD